MNTDPRIAREKKTIDAMVRIYCRSKHGNPDDLCPDCTELLDYALRRLDKCVFQQEKPACNHCTVHCYSRKRKEAIRQVMRYAGPRMLYRHPVLALFHLLDQRREAPVLEKKGRKRAI